LHAGLPSEEPSHAPTLIDRVAGPQRPTDAIAGAVGRAQHGTERFAQRQGPITQRRIDVAWKGWARLTERQRRRVTDLAASSLASHHRAMHVMETLSDVGRADAPGRQQAIYSVSFPRFVHRVLCTVKKCTRVQRSERISEGTSCT
jgi:hypothetical protein